jgi:hypothetical protein
LAFRHQHIDLPQLRDDLLGPVLSLSDPGIDSEKDAPTRHVRWRLHAEIALECRYLAPAVVENFFESGINPV